MLMEQEVAQIIRHTGIKLLIMKITCSTVQKSKSNQMLMLDSLT